MKLHYIHLTDVRGVSDRRYQFTDGVTVFVGANEAGKSTVAEALQLLLDEKDSTTKASIRSIRPAHNDADPTIELSCTTGPYTLTYRKVFGRSPKRRATTLTVSAPRPESHTGDEAHDRMQEILAETVDEQLWSALRVQQRHDVGQADLASSGALSAALDAANEGGATLRDDGTLMSRVDTAFGEFWTDGGKAKKLLTDADEASRTVGVMLDAARAELAGVADATARHDRLVHQIEGWRRALPELERTAKDAVEVVAGLASKRDAITTAERVVAAAHADLIRAQERGTQRAALVTQLASLQSSVTGRAAAADQVVKQAGDADLLVTEKRDERDVARGALDAAKAAHRAAESDVKLLRLDDEILTLSRRLTEAEAAHAAREDARATIDDDAPSAAAIERLEQLDFDVRTAAAVMEVDLPRLRITGPAGHTVAIDGTTTALGANGVDRAIDAEVSVNVDDVTMTVLPGASANALADQHVEAERALRVGLEHVGTTDVAAARARRDAAASAQSELDRAEDAWRQLLAADGLDGIRASLTHAQQSRAALQAGRVATQSLPPDVATAEAAVSAALDAVTASESSSRLAEATLEALVSAAGTARTDATTATVQLQSDRDRAAEVESALTSARAELADDALADAVTAAEMQLTDAAQARTEATEALAGLHVEGLEADAESAQAGLAATRRQRDDANESRAELWGSIKATTDRGLGERVPELEATLATATAKAAALHHKADALAMLRETLIRHRDAARARYQAPLKAEVERIGGVVFGDSFEVTLDDELKIITRTMDGTTLEVDQLSGGAQEQLAIITRLAAAALVDRKDGVPLILDDTLGFADPERRGRVNTLLGRVGQRNQIIVLTCDPDRFRGIPHATFRTIA
ncbi:MAG: energy-coupling factor transporter ATP-binding protein EcfA2 [Nitriliruptoraceae bacterium]